MQKYIAIIICLTLLPMATSQAAKGRKPCSGKKGGVSHCQGSKFVCNDGSISKSKRTCQGK